MGKSVDIKDPKSQTKVCHLCRTNQTQLTRHLAKKCLLIPETWKFDPVDSTDCQFCKSIFNFADANAYVSHLDICNRYNVSVERMKNSETRMTSKYARSPATGARNKFKSSSAAICPVVGLVEVIHMGGKKYFKWNDKYFEPGMFSSGNMGAFSAVNVSQDVLEAGATPYDTPMAQFNDFLSPYSPYANLSQIPNSNLSTGMEFINQLRATSLKDPQIVPITDPLFINADTNGPTYPDVRQMPYSASNTNQSTNYINSLFPIDERDTLSMDYLFQVDEKDKNDMFSNVVEK
ncbi:hypothetical protein HK103_005382 [Boothiomyces macroporosus]|uniref:Uncharacterized protein n=1 Tax=Boothiomyces macroporosus TaxID=261099 RepID=A0AAD5ULM3_9FUNG|nr:hypothetical protein HK103_005382 [Boothiomyces macroporosus]